MNRRDSLKAIGVGAVSAGLLLENCKPSKKTSNEKELVQEPTEGLQPFEIERNKKLHEEIFFTPEEMAVITVLADMIIPKDERSGSASDAGVPAFIEFIVKDIPDHKIPMRGGIRWLELQCMNRFGTSFVQCTPAQQVEIVEEIAYPDEAKPEMKQGVAFFNRMRDLTASGFFTSKMGLEDIGYAGNKPNRWTGVPEDVLKQYGLS
ncbi:gluconate 2-dehydrogenase subunit 3 family protein (plasmid) [Pedobacter sp. BS3]|uniref:gluconate 2-dehydrogenase subunit 3 family protein n=1 Tax=Pedobacter sp. BS3 TaxID=2567937 RepID=UPI0011ED3C0B|nr:gluconate 2-dehydrogenase subunit 3 family protein [Pedobacter sp. BS3]TZF85699.1 gluconate 2-dehydrogenase subunit 3 family protein [Pedobacter sp. BS3]